MTITRALGRVGYWLLVFCIPLAMFMFAMAVTGIHPFGDQSILSEDLRIQYIDFYAWYQGVLQGENSLFYSLTQSLGTNMWGLFAYYLTSPFTLLLVFFDENHLTDFVTLVTMLKLACISLSMVFYLRRRFGLNRGVALALGICFTFSMWTIIQTRNILWLDALILLPLIAYGLYSFVKKGSWRLLLISLTIAVITCWYTAYMLFLFSILLISLELYLYHVDERELSRKEVFKKYLRYVGIIVLALGLSMIVFLPAIMAMMTSGGTSLGEGFSWKSITALAIIIPVAIAMIVLFASNRLSVKTKCIIVASVAALVVLASFIFSFVGHASFFELLSCFFYGNQRGGVTPQFFSGTTVMVLLMTFFFTRAIPLRIKLALAIFLLIMVMSAWNNYLYFIWCGFKAPFGFYSRVAWLFVFVSIFAAAYVFKKMQEGEVKLGELGRAIASVIAVAVFLLIVGGLVFPSNLAITSGSALLCGIACAIYIKRADSEFARSLACTALVVLVVVEQSSLLHKEWQQFYIGYTQDYHDAYVQESKQQQDLLESYDSSWYREEKTHIREEPATLNEGLSSGYIQISSYASTGNYSAIGFLNALGYSNEGEFSVRFIEPILPSDSLLGVKYVSAPEAPIGFQETGLPQTSIGDSFYENPYALSIGYEVDEAAITLNLSTYDNPFDRQNALVSAFVGDEVACYLPAQAQLIVDDVDEKCWSIEVPPESFASFYIKPLEDVAVRVTVDNTREYRENWRFQHAIHAIGELTDESSVHEVMLTPEVGINEKTGLEIEPIVLAEPVFYYFDMKAFEAAINQLKENEFNPEIVEDGHVSGTYFAEDDSQLVLSIPNAPGWSASVNGEPVEIRGVCDNALMLISVYEGENKIELNYQTPGLVQGAFISGLSLIIALCLGLVSANRFRKTRKHV